MKKAMIFLTIVFTLLMTACDREHFDSDNSIPVPAPATGTLKDAPYTFGAAVNVASLKKSEAYRQTVISEMKQITAENAMKMNTISKARGEYNWTDADYIVEFAQQNGLKVHGHTLLWYKHTPDWVKKFRGTKEDWIEIMKEYIQAVVGRYKGKVQSWDVINEVITDKGVVYEEDGTKENVWMKNIGIEYIDLAFQFAREADPDAVLFYNDYGHEYSYERRQGVNALIQELKERNVPVDGIGMQMHTSITRSTMDIRNAIMTMAAATKLKIHISELDVALNKVTPPGDFELTEELLEKQQEWYREIAKAMTDLPAVQRYGITTWGVNDGGSWLASTPDFPLLFDDNYERKPAYEGLLQGFVNKK